MMSMQQRLELERRNKAPADITELNLDNCKASALEGLTDDYVNLDSLSLINVGLQSLAGFPALPKLRRLELSDNRLLDGLQHLAGCPALAQLNLSGNRIRDLAALKPLAGLGKLRTLDLYGCAVTESEGYRDAVFRLLPQVFFLDGLDADGQECEEDDDEEDEGEAGGDGEENYVNGDDYGEEDDEEDDGDDEEDNELGISYLQRGDVDDEEEEDDDFDPEAVGGEDDDDDIDDDEESEGVNASAASGAKSGGKVGAADAAANDDEGAGEASSSRRGTKRKHEGEAGEGGDD